jgi:hypothetical protein
VKSRCVYFSIFFDLLVPGHADKIIYLYLEGTNSVLEARTSKIYFVLCEGQNLHGFNLKRKNNLRCENLFPSRAFLLPF